MYRYDHWSYAESSIKNWAVLGHLTTLTWYSSFDLLYQMYAKIIIILFYRSLCLSECVCVNMRNILC